MTKIFAPIAAALLVTGVSAGAVQAAEDASNVTTGTVTHYSENSNTIWIQGEGAYHFRQSYDDFPDVSRGDEVQITFVTRNGVKYITSFDEI
ncbi:hypothetical protein [Pseudoroseicyclus tamaricis]|uniref:DUF5666 domain-containing protein n=1 Tax=Pseudoroseicyclus tamaricis TaxID=2705421 RepID=A0A6B2JZ64_9RHOB|nr:hypothetical protein [Pseudoroseicyclus tamaricis]NDU99415.1 hypothetical protein [Pseudoroseicyclus tamaricis]